MRAHTLKVEAAAWLEDGIYVCDQCPGEDEHVQNEVHALLFCQDHRVCELRKHFLFLFVHEWTMVTMVTMGGDLQPGSLADRLLTGLGQPQINP